jgi:hypothetical protein
VCARQVLGHSPAVVSLLEPMDTSSGTWYAVVNLANALCSYLSKKGYQKQFIGKVSNIPSLSYLRGLPTLKPMS